MAITAVTKNFRAPQRLASESLGGKVMFLSLALDTSYPTGGYALDVVSLFPQVRNVDQWFVRPFGGYTAEWDPVGKKLKIWSAAGAEVANATNLSAFTDVRMTLFTY